MKKLVVLGRGTAGAQAMAHFARWMPECELEWHFDPKIPTQSVGEGSTLTFPSNMFDNFGFTHGDLAKVEGTFKTGISKDGWGKTGKPHFHDFFPPSVAYHFNAVKLQDHIFSILKDKVKIVEENTSSSEIDADFIMDCSGKPSTLEKFHVPKYIPVNSVYVTQCYWDYPAFQYTINDARKHGWVFGIPLQGRCSIGYMYNKDISTIEEVKEDVKFMFEKYNLTPSETTNSFSFNNYIRKRNYTDRIVYNGNASFFLEPLEATSVGVMNLIQRQAYDVWNKKLSLEEANYNYLEELIRIERFIMMHYYAGSSFKTPFWEFAQERGSRCMEDLKKDKQFIKMFKIQKELQSLNICKDYGKIEYSQWWLGSLFQTIRGLDIQDDLSKLLL